MTPLEEQERFICRQLEDLREQYRKACEPWLKQLSYIRSFRPASYLVLVRDVLANDAEQRRVIEQQATRIQELEEWQKIVTGTGADQEAVVRMAATEYTKVAIQCWKEKCEQQAQQIATLREALQGILEIGKRDMTNPKYDGYFEQAKQAIKEVKP